MSRLTSTSTPEQTPSPSGTRNVLISFLSYDQDNFEYKRMDPSFMRSFGSPEEPSSRHEIWRPSVALAQLHGLNENYPDLIFSDYYLLWDEQDGQHRRIKEEVEKDILELARPPTLHIENPGITQPFDVQNVYKNLFTYLSKKEFQDPEATYYVNCTNGTTQIRNCLFLFTQTGHIRAMRIEPTPWDNHKQRDKKKDPARGHTQDGHRTVKGSYTLDDPKEFSKAYANVNADNAQKTFEILKKGVITKDEKLLRRIATIIDRIKAIAVDEFRMKQTILITGETGVGKTHLAGNMADALGLKTDQFIALNCATICGADPNIPRVELFGTTGKIENGEKKDGALLKADKGMLFLDEIGELSPEMQAMLLTALDTGTFIPLGGDPAHPLKSTFQLVCGTNRPLEQYVEEGKFRRDLFNRINTWHFKLRPLRDNRKDITYNVDRLISDIGNKCGKIKLAFAPEAGKTFCKFAEEDQQVKWYGNFRELNAMVTRMVVLSDGLSIKPEIVEAEIKAARERYAESEETQPMADAAVKPPVPAERPTPIPASPTPPAHAGIRNFDATAYGRLTPLERAEFDLIDRAVNVEKITDRDKLCAAVYGGKLQVASLYNRLKAIGLKFSHKELTHVPPTRQKADEAGVNRTPTQDRPNGGSGSARTSRIPQCR